MVAFEGHFVVFLFSFYIHAISIGYFDMTHHILLYVLVNINKIIVTMAED